MPNVTPGLTRHHNSPSFCGSLTRDHYRGDSDPEYSTVPTRCISQVWRASQAIGTISRIVHDSLSEPAMSNTEPLGLSAHLGLLDAMEIVGEYLNTVADEMYDRSQEYAQLAQSQEPSHD